MNSNYDRTKSYLTSMELMLKQRRKFLLNANTRWHGQKDARR